MGAHNLTIRRVAAGKSGDPKKRDVAVDVLSPEEIRRAESWYLIHTSAAREVEAARLLRLMGMLAWVPRGERFKRVGGSRRPVRLTPTRYAAFAGYLFVGVRQGEADWRALFETGLVHGVIGDNGAPYRVPVRSLVQVTHRQRRGVYDLSADDMVKARALPDVKAGETWRIGSGPLRGYDVPVVAVNGAIARVLVDLFQMQKPVELRLDVFLRRSYEGAQR